MARTNYSYEKRQRDLAKKRKKEAKRQRKMDKKGGQPEGTSPESPAAADSDV